MTPARAALRPIFLLPSQPLIVDVGTPPGSNTTTNTSLGSTVTPIRKT
ncbi:MAG: hypothetical protein ACP5O0_09870 [Acidimicrobiales bacterium]